ncbi:uncharacterized protein ColSpa_08928 [Colletotrichum spaethianum]|uniref:Uncharacterized protein n=1 Tax=Colletotrichum spaethianum TaxID=700344 RepID=A0AA37PAP3_9PEZI|nr:uncharacterized protein ColSpa_08928 [Colletotrichum spaethianum]GKT48747.1 hypothetical protein ColSpa_08928 [Colletotrichum spaethianum]
MKSPSPAGTTPPGDRTTSGAGIDAVVRSASSLIKDVNAEFHREMEEVLSPRTAALVAASESAKEMEYVDTPTRRPPRQKRSLPAPVPWSPPVHPAPTKPLPPVPQKKSTRSNTPSRTSVSADNGPCPALTQAPAPPQSPPPPPPVHTAGPNFYDPYPPPRVIWTNGDVTVSDFSIPKRIVRPTASMTAISLRPPTLINQTQKVRRPESAANFQSPATAEAPSRSRTPGKVVSMAELKERVEAESSDGSGSDEAIGLKTFLSEDVAVAPVSANENKEKNGKPENRDKSDRSNKSGTSEKSERSEKYNEGSKKKLFGKLFRRNKKDGEM